MNEKHTPGPWATQRFTSDDVDETLFPGERYWRLESLSTPEWPRMLAIVYGDNAVWLTQAEQEANARLIAAAPALLAACEEIVAAHNGANGRSVGQVVGMVRAAIAKARTP